MTLYDILCDHIIVVDTQDSKIVIDIQKHQKVEARYRGLMENGSGSCVGERHWPISP